MDHLSREAVLLYFFLAAVADKHGLSFYGDGTLAALLRMPLPALLQARDELLAHDLIAHETAFTQVLSLPPPLPAPPVRARRRADATGRYLAPGHRVATFRPGKEPAMKVGLWAEIRRLAEIEKLSGRAISRRLHCSRHTVAAALELDQPPARPVRQPRQPLGPVQGQDRRPAGQVSRTLGGAHPRGDCSRPRWLSPAARSSSAAICGPSVPHAGASTRKSTTSRPRRCRSTGASAAACQIGNTTRKVSVFVAVLCYSRLMYHRVHALAAQGGILSRPGACPGVLRWQSPRHHLRQLESGRAQWLGPRRLFPSRVPGAVRPLLPAADRLRTARSRNPKGSSREACAT